MINANTAAQPAVSRSRGRLAYFGIIVALLIIIGRNIYQKYRINRQQSLSAEMCEAAERGDVGLIRSLLNKGVSINTRNARGESPLMGAIIYGQIKASDFILEHGANTDDGSLPLAASNGNVNLCRQLIQRGASIYMPTRKMWLFSQ